MHCSACNMIKWNAFVFFSAIDFFFYSIWSQAISCPSLVRFNCCFFFGGGGGICLLMISSSVWWGTWVFSGKWDVVHWRVLVNMAPVPVSNYRPGTEGCQSERQMVQWLYLSLTSSFPSLNPFLSLKPGPTIFQKMTTTSKRDWFINTIYNINIKKTIVCFLSCLQPSIWLFYADFCVIIQSSHSYQY